MSDKPTQVEELVQKALEQGVSVGAVDDGSIFTFTTAMLEELLRQSQSAGKVMVFVRHGTPKKIQQGPDIDLSDFDLGGVLN